MAHLAQVPSHATARVQLECLPQVGHLAVIAAIFGPLEGVLDELPSAPQGGGQVPQGAGGDDPLPGLHSRAGEQGEELGWLEVGHRAPREGQSCLLPLHVCECRFRVRLRLRCGGLSVSERADPLASWMGFKVAVPGWG